MKNMCAFTDAHITPGTSLERFHCLGMYIADQQPDIIWQGGDFATVESLSGWDVDKRLLVEGRRVEKDLAAAHQAWANTELHIRDLQEQQRKWKVKIWKPELIWHLGNHEDRITRWVERTPEMHGFLKAEDTFKYDPSLYSKVTLVPWRETIAREGVLFCHAPHNRNGPINSKYLSARALADMANSSIIFGHTHRKAADSIARYTARGDEVELEIIRAMNVGHFFEEWPEYIKGNTVDWWGGIHSINLWGNGEFTADEISMRELYTGVA
jgi:predicted phosphodiesterase